MYHFIQILGQADPEGLAFIIFIIKAVLIGITVFCIALLIISALLILFLIYKLIAYIMRKKCRNCKKTLGKSDKFCNNCGTKVE